MSAKARELLSPRAFGEALGVTRQAVNKAIEAGRLKEAVTRDEKTGHKLVDLERGRREWEEWTDPAHKKRPGRKPSGRPSSASKGTPSLFETENDRARKVEQLTHARASAERISLDSQLKRLELERELGNSLDKAEVQRTAFAEGRLVRDRLQAIPDRISAQLAAMTEPAQVHECLASEIAKALEALSQDEGAA